MNLDVNKLTTAFAMNTSLLTEEMERSYKVASEINRHATQRAETLVAGAEASIAQKELLERQLEVIQKQNKLLYDNYEKLKELFDAQVQANQEAKEDLKRSRIFNIWMMIIAVVAMLAAIAGPIATIMVS